MTWSDEELAVEGRLWCFLDGDWVPSPEEIQYQCNQIPKEPLQAADAEDLGSAMITMAVEDIQALNRKCKDAPTNPRLFALWAYQNRAIPLAKDAIRAIIWLTHESCTSDGITFDDACFLAGIRPIQRFREDIQKLLTITSKAYMALQLVSQQGIYAA